jgi:amino acid permease
MLESVVMATPCDMPMMYGWLNSATGQNSSVNFRYEAFVLLDAQSLTLVPQMIELIAFSFSIMGVVASVSSTFSFPLVSGGHVGMVFGWLIPCLFVLTIAASMAEMASSMP